MSDLRVSFDLPDIILSGITSGRYERLGGVIRDVSSKQIVAWLRENPVVGVSHLETGDNIRRILMGFGANPLIAANLTLAGFLFLQAINQAATLSQKFEEMAEEMADQFWRDRDAQFLAGLQMAQNAFDSADRSFARSMNANALQILYQSSFHFQGEIDRILHIMPVIPARLREMNYWLQRLILCEQVITRCLHQQGERQSAIARIKDRLPLIQRGVVQLFSRSLQPAYLFFHKNTQRSELMRYLRLREWLDSSVLGNPSANTILDVLEEVRPHFWDMEVFGNSLPQIFSRIFNNTDNVVSLQLSELISRLSEAEAIIEDLLRLQSYELELRAERLTDLEIPPEELQALPPVFAVIQSSLDSQES
jgi:hypothetical protein